jgi:hypothetical protein
MRLGGTLLFVRVLFLLLYFLLQCLEYIWAPFRAWESASDYAKYVKGRGINMSSNKDAPTIIGNLLFLVNKCLSLPRCFFRVFVAAKQSSETKLQQVASLLVN